MRNVSVSLLIFLASFAASREAHAQAGIIVNGAPVSTANPMPVVGSSGGTPVSPTNPQPVVAYSQHTTPVQGSVALASGGVVVISTAQINAANALYVQAQGTGYGCVTYSAGAYSVPSANAATATCTASGFLIGPGSVISGGPGVLPNVQMTATQASGAALTLNFLLN